MQRALKSAVCLLTIAAISPANPAYSIGQRLPAPDIVERPGIILAAINETDTAAIVDTLNSGREECAALPAEYRADCLQQVLGQASRKQFNGEYQSSSARLREGSRAIKRAVDQNLDPQAETISRNGRRFRAVKRQALSAVNRSASTAIAETATRLLRSGGRAERKAHYARIAQAVNSTKVILRS